MGCRPGDANMPARAFRARSRRSNPRYARGTRPCAPGVTAVRNREAGFGAQSFRRAGPRALVEHETFGPRSVTTTPTQLSLPFLGSTNAIVALRDAGETTIPIRLQQRPLLVRSSGAGPGRSASRGQSPIPARAPARAATSASSVAMIPKFLRERVQSSSRH